MSQSSMSSGYCDENEGAIEHSNKRRKPVSPIKLPHCGSWWKERHANSILLFYSSAPAISTPTPVAVHGGHVRPAARDGDVCSRTASASDIASCSTSRPSTSAISVLKSATTGQNAGRPTPAAVLDGKCVPDDFCKLKDFSHVLDYAYIFFKVADINADEMGMFMSPSLRKLKDVFSSQFLFDIRHAGNSSRTAMEILESPKNVVGIELEEDEKSILDQVEKSLSDQLHSVTHKRAMLRSGSLGPDSLTTYTCMGGIIKFLDQMKKMLRRCSEMGIAPNERNFVSLFQSFADIFGIQFDEGRSTTSTICGQEVESIPDLLCEKTQETNNQPGISVVTVAEVKKRGFKEKEEVDNKPWTRASSKRRRIAHSEDDKEVTDLSRHCRRGYVDYVEDKDEESEEEKEDKESDVANDIDLPSELKGQHASQLLTKLPYSCLGKNIFDRQRIMGLIIQGTHVRLTCLSMTTEHLHQLMNPPLYDQLHEGRIWFTRGYDMLVPDDRQHLVYIMLGLAYLGDVHRLQLLP